MLGDMSYGPRARDRYRLVVATLTGAATVGAITSTGWIAAVAAADFDDELADKVAQARVAASAQATAQAEYAAALAAFEAAKVRPQRLAATDPVIALTPLPTEERVATQYLGESGSSTVGSGGKVRSGSTQQNGDGQSGDGQSAGSKSGSGGTDSGGDATAPPPPPPPPPPPSSGS